ncbi:MAG: RNA binding protein snu13 [Marteilia pararefringens]
MVSSLAAESHENIEDPRVTPLATPHLTTQVLKLVRSYKNASKLKKGNNECVKAITKGIAQLVVIAADTEPIELCLNLPDLCEEKGVPFVFVPSKQLLGRECDMSRGIISCALLTDETGTLDAALSSLKLAIDTINV